MPRRRAAEALAGMEVRRGRCCIRAASPAAEPRLGRGRRETVKGAGNLVLEAGSGVAVPVGFRDDGRATKRRPAASGLSQEQARKAGRAKRREDVELDDQLAFFFRCPAVAVAGFHQQGHEPPHRQQFGEHMPGFALLAGQKTIQGAVRHGAGSSRFSLDAALRRPISPALSSRSRIFLPDAPSDKGPSSPAPGALGSQDGEHGDGRTDLPAGVVLDATTPVRPATMARLVLSSAPTTEPSAPA